MILYNSLSFRMFSDESLIRKVNIKLIKLIYFFLTFYCHMKKCLHQLKYLHNQN